MAARAVLLKHGAAVTQVGGFQGVWGQLCFELLRFGLLIGRCAADGAPDTGQALIDAIVRERLKLADREGRDVLTRNHSFVDGVEESEGERGAGGEGLNRVLALGSGERG